MSTKPPQPTEALTFSDVELARESSRKPDPPPEGRLLRDALARQGKTLRQAAAETGQRGLSLSNWRLYLDGGAWIDGNWVKRPRDPETLARMALYLEVTPAELESVGRTDAAVVLRTLLREQANRGPEGTVVNVPSGDPDIKIFAFVTGDPAKADPIQLRHVIRQAVERLKYPPR